MSVNQDDKPSHGNTLYNQWSHLLPDKHIFIVVEMHPAWLQLQFAMVPGVQSANLRTVLDSPRDKYCVWSTTALYYNHRVLLAVILQSDL